MLTLNNKAEAGAPPPPPVDPTTTPIDPKSASKDIRAELGATFDPTNFFNSLKRKLKSRLIIMVLNLMLKQKHRSY